MKIKPEHVQHIHDCLARLGDKVATHAAYLASESNPRPPKDLQKRLRWDCFNAVIPAAWTCSHVYPYANDEHLDTALRHVMSDLYPTI